MARRKGEWMIIPRPFPAPTIREKGDPDRPVNLSPPATPRAWLRAWGLVIVLCAAIGVCAIAAYFAWLLAMHD